MAKTELKVVVANRAALLVPTGFSGYDLCLNTYVGCQFGCSYCYVRFFVKDADRDWGHFVRTRDHVRDRLPRELATARFRLPTKGRRPKMHNGAPVVRNGRPVMETVYCDIDRGAARLVLGTMTDPYQPVERTHRLTRTALNEILTSCDTHGPVGKVGIFTRSPIIEDDLDRIAQLPRRRVHFTVTPCHQDVLRTIEPIAIPMRRRFETIARLKAAGARVHCSVAPAVPLLSDDLTDDVAGMLADVDIDEFFVNALQPYGEALAALDVAMAADAHWSDVRAVVTDGDAMAAWKDGYRRAWAAAWRRVQHRSPHTLPIWSDHETGTWTDMRTGAALNKRAYGDDAARGLERAMADDIPGTL